MEKLYLAGRRYLWEMLGFIAEALLFMLYASPEAFPQKPASALSQGSNAHERQSKQHEDRRSFHPAGY
jgi:hypothetical protein